MQQAQEKAEADAKAAAEAQAQAEAQAEAAKAQSEEDARKRAQAEADAKAAAAAQAQAQRTEAAAEAARAAALAQQQAAEAEAEKQRQAAEEANRQKEAMRARLLKQLNDVLETKDTDRGLVVNMPDVLFDFGKYTLKPEARERLARISGIVMAYPELKFEIEGYTDNIGSDAYNQTLSEKRADGVKDYLVTNGVTADSITTRGMGKSDPVAPNNTAAGRKLNRRVEMIVSGDVIGTQIGTPAGGTTPTPDATQPAAHP